MIRDPGVAIGRGGCPSRGTGARLVRAGPGPARRRFSAPPAAPAAASLPRVTGGREGSGRPRGERPPAGLRPRPASGLSRDRRRLPAVPWPPQVWSPRLPSGVPALPPPRGAAGRSRRCCRAGGGPGAVCGCAGEFRACRGSRGCWRSLPAPRCWEPACSCPRLGLGWGRSSCWRESPGARPRGWSVASGWGCGVARASAWARGRLRGTGTWLPYSSLVGASGIFWRKCNCRGARVAATCWGLAHAYRVLLKEGFSVPSEGREGLWGWEQTPEAAAPARSSTETAAAPRPRAGAAAEAEAQPTPVSGAPGEKTNTPSNALAVYAVRTEQGHRQKRRRRRQSQGQSPHPEPCGSCQRGGRISAAPQVLKFGNQDVMNFNLGILLAAALIPGAAPSL
ncbi:uncharacterized protein LOC141955586 [Athene noctua]|uniref:uncharacterized protein LOC141955584 n=1 Tax=Athene noctua TaxID=126797 RepID=UPI003EB9A228